MVSAIVDIILDLIQGGGEEAVASYYQSTSGLTQLIRAGTLQGMSGRGILAAYRGAGGSISDTFYWALRRAVVQQLDPLKGFLNPLGDLSSIVQHLPGGQQDRYQLNFRTYVQHSGPGGTTFYTNKMYSVIQDELDGEGGIEAMRSASDVHDNPEDDSLGRILGYELESVYQYA